MSLNDLEAEKISELCELSKGALSNAYCPYSKFSVGAALLTEDGRFFTGCNVENASYGLSVCAERTVIVKAVSEGCRKFKALAIATSSKNEVIGPCGACRQVIVEFGTDWNIYLIKTDGSYVKHSAAELLPYAFTPDSLSKV
ncbi:Cytidine deaminase, partial [Stegodyphus mimosarum]